MTDIGARQLDEVRNILGLSQTELADLFRVRQSTLEKWRLRGIPPTRRAKVVRLSRLATVLESKVIQSRIPEVVRSSDARLGDRSMLEVIRAEGVAPIFDYLTRLFSYTDDRD